MLLVAATPIGNLDDHSPRLVRALQDADLIVAEDTRTTGQLMRLLGATSHAPVMALHEHNETDVTEKVLGHAARGVVVLVSDAGMPGLSDPGFPVVRAAHAKGIPVSVVPGPSAITAALAVSGMPTDRFCFEGFIPKKAREEFFRQRAGERRTLVFFESPHRLHQSLRQMAEVFGADREATVCRELTKKFEQVSSGTLASMAEQFSGDVKGEITLVVHGATGEEVSFHEAVEDVRERVAAGEKPAEAAKAISQVTGHSKRDLYRALLEPDA